MARDSACCNTPLPAEGVSFGDHSVCRRAGRPHVDHATGNIMSMEHDVTLFSAGRPGFSAWATSLGSAGEAPAPYNTSEPLGQYLADVVPGSARRLGRASKLAAIKAWKGLEGLAQDSLVL